MASRNLSTTELVHKLISELKPLADMLAPNMRRVIEGFFNYILQFRAAISNATNLLPLEAALFIIQAQEKIHNSHEINELHKRIDEIEKKLEELINLQNEET